MKSIFIICCALATLTLAGCNKTGENHPCFDQSLVHNGACTADCPGFKGCDGVKYCNECEAARHGIGPK